MFGDLISLLTLQSLADAISAVLAIPLVPALALGVMGIGLVPFVFRRLYRLLSLDVAKTEAVQQAQFEIDLAQFMLKHPGQSVEQKVADELGLSVVELRSPFGLTQAIRNAEGQYLCPDCNAVIDEEYVPDGSLGCSECGWFEWDDDMPAGVERKPRSHAPGYSVSGRGPEMDPVEAQDILDAEQRDYERMMAHGWDPSDDDEKRINNSVRRHNKRLYRDYRRENKAILRGKPEEVDLPF